VLFSKYAETTTASFLISGRILLLLGAGIDIWLENGLGESGMKEYLTLLNRALGFKCSVAVCQGLY
jgi:hypothetical protein